MNEEFIRQFRKSPDLQMVEKIHSRLERKERAQRYKSYFTRSAIMLLLTFGMLMTISSTARAEVTQTIARSQLGEILICYVGFNPIGTYINRTFIESNLVNCSGDGVLTINPNETLSLEDAQSHFTTPISLPTYVPKGFDRSDAIEFFDLADQPTLVITWELKNDYKRVKFLVSHHSIELRTYARTLGKGAIEDVTLNGKPALIVRGVWNIGMQDNDFLMTAIMWRYDENTVYALMSFEQAVPLDELIKMAESIP